MNPVIMHVNYGETSFNSYGSNTVDDICRMAAELGFDGIEFRGNPPKNMAEVSFEDYVNQIKAGKEKYGLPTMMFSIGIPGVYAEDKAERAASVQRALDKARYVQDACGTTLCNTSAATVRNPNEPYSAYHLQGSAIATQDHWDMTVEAYQELAKGLEALGMKFAFETHMNYIHDLPEPSKKLVDLIDSPNVGINMDFGNTVYFPEYPTVEETIDIYGDKLFYTHLKNSVAVNGTNMATALSEGRINHRIYLKKLQSVGFTGPIGIEAPRPGDRYWFAQQDLAYYKALRASL